VERAVSGRREHGVVLFIVLIALVGMMLAGLAFARSLGAGLLVAGNLGFKRSMTEAADYGIERGRQWYQANFTAGLDLDRPADGYYASYRTFDPLVDDWSTRSRLVPAAETPATAVEVRYVVHRLCSTTGPANPVDCVMADNLAQSSSTVGASVGNVPLTAPGKVFYRVTARVVGPKNTVSLVQTILY
jgi:type IV pilus assembly protein PilX